MSSENDPLQAESHFLLRNIQGDEDLEAAAREYMAEYRANALARPVWAHVDLLRVRLKAQLTELLLALRDGRL